MKKKKIFFSSLLLVVCIMLSVSFSACGITTIEISSKEEQVKVGETVRLVATASDKSMISWTSEDESIAIVSEIGLVQGIKEGTTTIKATGGRASAVCKITVIKADIVITFDEGEKEVKIGETITVKANASDNSKVTYSSADEAIALVDTQSGVVTGVAEGEAIITATNGTIKAEYTIKVLSNHAEDYQEIIPGEQTSAIENAGKWYYQKEEQKDINITCSEWNNGCAKIEYNSTGCDWNGMQVFYKNPECVINSNCKLNCIIDSEMEGEITLNGKVCPLEKGENQLEVYYIEKENIPSFCLQMGTEEENKCIQTNKVTIRNIAFENYTPQPLKTPTAISINEEKIIYVADENNSKDTCYRLYFYEKGNMNQEKYCIDACNGSQLDDSKMEEGEYVVKAIAVGQNQYSDSALSTVSIVYTVKHDTNSMNK